MIGAFLCVGQIKNYLKLSCVCRVFGGGELAEKFQTVNGSYENGLACERFWDYILSRNSYNAYSGEK